MAEWYKRLALTQVWEPGFEPPRIHDICFVIPFEKGVEYSLLSLSHNRNNSDTVY